jgi:hypothetical protein
VETRLIVVVDDTLSTAAGMAAVTCDLYDVLLGSIAAVITAIL